MNAIEMRGITKIFPGIIANDAVDFSVQEGEIHALLGENGAGKSTLMSILFGLYERDGGEILIHGKKAEIRNPREATALGIGMVHQHFKLVHNFTVTENIILGLESRDALGQVDLATARERVAELSNRYGLSVDPDARISDISVGMQQRVEILKILYRDADILIFDEPTAVLTPQEVDELLSILERLKGEGKTIVLITHKLREIKAASSRCTVLRRGKLAGVVDVASTSEAELAELMVGRAVRFDLDRKPLNAGATVLDIQTLSVRGAEGHLAVHDLSLTVRSGEIVGLAGVDGNGQEELVGAIAGLLPVASGRISIKGRDITRLSIRERILVGLGLVPEDRQKHGLVLDFSLAENLVLKSFRSPPFSSRLGFLRPEPMRSLASELIGQFDIRAAKGPATAARSMSGGNQQKAILARELRLSPDLLVIAQPTRGLDVGAIEYIHRRILEERDRGKAILLVSFELDEILGLCDRIAAISKGAIVGIVDSAEADERTIGAMMAGVSYEK